VGLSDPGKGNKRKATITVIDNHLFF
jgi:hypothetical protein